MILYTGPVDVYFACSQLAIELSSTRPALEFTDSLDIIASKPPDPMTKQLRSGTPWSLPQGPEILTHNEDSQYDAVPQSLLMKKVSGYQMECINVGPYAGIEYGNSPKRKLHAILQVFFKHTMANATIYAPAGTNGVLIDIETGDKAGDTLTSTLMVKATNYAGHHKDTLLVIGIPAVATLPPFPQQEVAGLSAGVSRAWCAAIRICVERRRLDWL